MRRFLIILPVALLMACTGSSPGASQPAGSQPGASEAGASEAAASVPAASVPAASVPAGSGGASVDLTITGGTYAGHYTAEITVGGCSTGTYGPGSFTVASTTVEPDTAFDGPQLTIYDSAAAASGTDEQFSAAFIFDNYATTVEVNPYLDLGTGTATLDNRGSTATITIEGTSSDGDGVSATIECHTVTNF